MRKKLLKVLKYILSALAVLIIVLLTVRLIGKAVYSKIPDGGINESMYVKINGVDQWINIYGDDMDNPVLLYLHGGPGSCSSEIDYAFTRKWADVYTVVTWDQRNCGKSYDKGQNDTVLTRDMFMEDGKELTEFLLDYLEKEKITILGHSWGSIFGANLVLSYPEYYECFIGTGQLIDSLENEIVFKEIVFQWAGDDEEVLTLVSQLTPDNLIMDHLNARNAIMEKYGYGMMVDGIDYNLYTTVLFNPNYSLLDWINYFRRDNGVYMEFIKSDEFNSFLVNCETLN